MTSFMFMIFTFYVHVITSCFHITMTSSPFMFMSSQVVFILRWHHHLLCSCHHKLCSYYDDIITFYVHVITSCVRIIMTSSYGFNNQIVRYLNDFVMLLEFICTAGCSGRPYRTFTTQSSRLWENAGNSSKNFPGLCLFQISYLFWQLV